MPPQSAAARREKKREQDRHCQRMARERTRNRLMYLETLVVDLKQQDTTKQVQDLLKHRDEIAAERDSLAQSLRAIERAFESTKKVLANIKVQPTQPALVSKVHGQSSCISSPGPDLNFNSHSNSILDQAPPHSTFELWPTTTEDSDSDVQHQPSSTFGGPQGLLTPKLSVATEFSPIPVNTILAEQDVLFDRWDLDPNVPRPTVACDCSPDFAFVSDHKQVNLWRFANETLSEPVEWSTQTCRIEEELEDDTPVRAMLEGWDAVEKHAGGRLPPLWCKLRRIDETLFSSCAKTERLAILRSMYSLLRYHQDASHDRRVALPAWYLARPSQSMAHSYAIDYFAWPGLRERFVFYEHRYCSNSFWDRFCSNLHILWPFEFRDCYSYNTITKQYTISPTFQERISDIKAWTMSADIFKIWPEFSSDIPVYDSIPRSISDSVPTKRLRQLSGDWTYVASDSPGSNCISQDAENSLENQGQQNNPEANSGAMAGRTLAHMPEGSSYPFSSFDDMPLQICSS